jgi:integrase/recombinase XerD
VAKVPEFDLDDLLTSWTLALRAERKSAQTVKTYTDGVKAYLRHLDEAGLPARITRASLRSFDLALQDGGAKPATVASRHLAVRRFSAWIAEEEPTYLDEVAGMKSPKIDQPSTIPLTDQQLRALVLACRGPEMRDKRDEALVRLMASTGMRAGEVVALTLDSLHLANEPPFVHIERGKGGKGRTVPLAPEVARSIDRYRRARRGHRLADTPPLWLGDRGKLFSYDALHKTLKYRAGLAGIEGFHPHLLRHTAAHRWLAKGGSEGGLMAVAGWTRPDMLQRYTKARAEERAITEAQTLNLGDL